MCLLTETRALSAQGEKRALVGNLTMPAIRPAVVNRKICGGNRTPRGARTQQILASVVRTARQRHVDLDDLFTTLLRAPRPIVPAALHPPTQ